MNELLKFGRYHHIFGQNEKLNTDEFVNKRRCALAKAGVTSALASLAKTDKRNCKELIARVFNAICIPEEVREVVVQQGRAEALLSLALDGTDKGKKYASRALVHLALTIDPEVAFPGQLIVEVVRPIVNFLEPECSVNETCETLTALCNLASVNNKMRKRIFNEAGFEKFTNYVKSDNYMLKLKSALLFENLTLCREIAIQCRELDSRIMYLVFDTLWNDESTKMKIIRQLILEVYSEDHGGQ
ncbi:protein unc-45 homolog B-like [Temnothorax longispinosus]|uniref:protein unc-45 homolog B-like n=1 Tax=Temnothorax longispinosus TaxID=300112 RepID=UPI003A99898D